jgi:hypothetical protein
MVIEKERLKTELSNVQMELASSNDKVSEELKISIQFFCWKEGIQNDFLFVITSLTGAQPPLTPFTLSRIFNLRLKVSKVVIISLGRREYVNF